MIRIPQRGSSNRVQRSIAQGNASGHRQVAPGTATTLDAALQSLSDRLERMFSAVDEQLTDTVNALVSGDAALASKIRTGDRTIDALELENGEHCLQILEEHRPGGNALRTVLAALRVGSSLERVGDQCKNVAKAIPVATPVNGWLTQTGIIDIADATRQILLSAHDAYSSLDRLKARQVLAFDRQVDRAYRDALDAIVMLGQSNPGRPEALLYLAAICKSIERIGDHAKSIARNVVFVIEGNDIRYGQVRAEQASS